MNMDLDHNWPYHASKDLLMKRKPKLVGRNDAASLLANPYLPSAIGKLSYR
jgi:hypothetical protein